MADETGAEVARGLGGGLSLRVRPSSTTGPAPGQRASWATRWSTSTPLTSSACSRPATLTSASAPVPENATRGPIENGPYIKDGKPTKSRPKLSGKKRLEFEQAVYDKQIACLKTLGIDDGKLHEPYKPYAVIDWKPEQGRNGAVDFGHKRNQEYRKVFNQYKNGEISLEDLKRHEFSPDNFQIGLPGPNRSHLHEAP